MLAFRYISSVLGAQSHGLLSTTAVRVLAPSLSRCFFRVIHQWEKGVTFTMGKLTAVKEPGWRICFPIIQDMMLIDMRTRVAELQSQDIMTADNVACSVSAVVYYKVHDARKAVANVENFNWAIRNLAQTEMRDVLCSNQFAFILEKREEMGQAITASLKQDASVWGLLVERVQMKAIDLVDGNMARALAREAEATRERTASIIRADGMELRQLQTLERMAKEKSNNTLVVPWPEFDEEPSLSSPQQPASSPPSPTSSTAASGTV